MGNKKSKNAKVGEIWSIRGAESKGHPSAGITKGQVHLLQLKNNPLSEGFYIICYIV